MARKRKPQKPVDPDAGHFRLLGRLRAGGRTNMYGAIPYLMRAHQVDRDEAFRVVCRWIDLQAAPSEKVAADRPDLRPTVVGRIKPGTQMALALDEPRSGERQRKHRTAEAAQPARARKAHRR